MKVKLIYKFLKYLTPIKTIYFINLIKLVYPDSSYIRRKFEIN